LKRTGNTAPLLVARFIGRVVSDETAKLVPAELAVPPPPSDLPEPDALQPSAYGSEYTYNDHMERLRHLEIEESPSTEEEVTLLKKILANAMAGLEEFFKDDQKYLTLKGTMLYNGIGVSYSGGRDDKV
jgi:import receptor subunit TOM20